MRRLANVLTVVALAGAAPAPQAMLAELRSGEPTARRTVEVRSYNLKPGRRSEFDRLASEVAVPMLQRWKIDVVAYGPSPHDDLSYYLIRAFADMADRQRNEDAFYGSDEWRQGPREQILALIDSYTTVVLDLDEEAVKRLRRRPLAAAIVSTSMSDSLRASSLDDKKAVAALDKEYQAAVKRNDTATMGRILADDFVLVTGKGTTFTKADLIKEASGGNYVYEKQDELSQTVRVWGDTAVVTALLWVKGAESGKPMDYKLWFSDTYVRTPTGWKYVLGQASLPLPQAAGN